MLLRQIWQDAVRGARWGLEYLDCLRDIWASELTSQGYFMRENVKTCSGWEVQKYRYIYIYIYMFAFWVVWPPLHVSQCSSLTDGLVIWSTAPWIFSVRPSILHRMYDSCFRMTSEHVYTYHMRVYVSLSLSHVYICIEREREKDVYTQCIQQSTYIYIYIYVERWFFVLDDGHGYCVTYASLLLYS